VFQKWLFWPLFASIMGFAVGGQCFLGPVWTERDDKAGHTVTVEHPAKARRHRGKGADVARKADEALARYTFWLTVFTGVLAFATVGWHRNGWGCISPAKSKSASLNNLLTQRH